MKVRYIYIYKYIKFRGVIKKIKIKFTCNREIFLGGKEIFFFFFETYACKGPDEQTCQVSGENATYVHGERKYVSFKIWNEEERRIEHAHKEIDNRISNENTNKSFATAKY